MRKCRKCSREAAPGKASCGVCLERKRQQNKRVRQKRIDSNHCSNCGSTCDVVGRKMCSICHTTSRTNAAEHRNKRRDNLECVSCGAQTKRKLCDRCQAKKVKSEKQRRDRLRAEGKCVWCSSLIDTDGSLCQYCCIKGAARAWLGGADQTDVLKDLLEAQGSLCPYTGRKLVPGKNASIDHKVPRSRGGEDKVENLQWVDGEVNRAKTSMPHDEFIALCHLVASRFPL